MASCFEHSSDGPGASKEALQAVTETYFTAIDCAPEEGVARKPELDLRLSIPFFRRRYFLTLLGGQEKRSLARVKNEKAKHPLWTIVNIGILSFALLFLIPVILGLSHIVVAFTDK